MSGMSSASGRVFSIPELLLTILLKLDMRTLLTTAQRIDRRFHDTINHTPAIQKALFFPARKEAGEKCVDSEEVVQNPLLVELFPPWFQEVGPYPTSYEVALTSLPMTVHNALPAFLRREASWRNMLVQQPPVLAVGLWKQLSHQRADFHSFRVLARWCPDGGGGPGLCMGALYDMVIGSTTGRLPDAFRVFWVGRGDLAYLERRPLARQMTPQDRDEAARLVGEVGVLLHVYRDSVRPNWPCDRTGRNIWMRKNIKSFKFPQEEDAKGDGRA